MFYHLFECDSCGTCYKRNTIFTITSISGFVLDESWESWPEGWVWQPDGHKLWCPDCKPKGINSADT